jgi:hypothetical protein
MKAWIGRVGLGIVLVSAGFVFGNIYPTAVKAQKQATVPRAYGKVVGGGGATLVFEDSAGTLRVLDIDSLKIEVQVTRN